jgi:hypothetical protein
MMGWDFERQQQQLKSWVLEKHLLSSYHARRTIDPIYFGIKT